MKQSLTIWTIGHSTRDFEEFVALLHANKIQLLADIRSFPGSRKYPQFNKEALELALPENGVQYIHLVELGGRRKAKPDSQNKGWRHPAFRGYADYMETEAFLSAAEELQKIAGQKRTAIMCSEAVWWRCHRSLVADYLKLKGWTVLHITTATKTTEHPYTSPARIEGGKLTYDAGQNGSEKAANTDIN